MICPGSAGEIMQSSTLQSRGPNKLGKGRILQCEKESLYATKKTPIWYLLWFRKRHVSFIKHQFRWENCSAYNSLWNNQMHLLIIRVTDSKFKLKCRLVIFPLRFWLLFGDGHRIPLMSGVWEGAGERDAPLHEVSHPNSQRKWWTVL